MRCAGLHIDGSRLRTAAEGLHVIERAVQRGQSLPANARRAQTVTCAFYLEFWLPHDFDCPWGRHLFLKCLVI